MKPCRNYGCVSEGGCVRECVRVCCPCGPTGDGGVEVLEVLNLAGPLGRRQTLVVDLEEVPQRQLHVGHRRAEIVTVVRPYRTHKQCLTYKSQSRRLQ